MTDDDVLARIGGAAREAQKDDRRFERVARNEAGPDELADLERAAADDPELAVRLEGSLPFDAAAVDRIAKGVHAAHVAMKPAAVKQANVIVLRPGASDAPDTHGKSAAGAASPWRRRLILAAGPLALAAAMVVYVTGQSGPRVPELPLYTVTATGPQAMRGSSEASTRLRLPKAAGREARFELLLRPATAPHEKVVAYPFTFGGPGATEPAPLEAKVEIAPEGGVKLTGASRALEGAAEIRIVIGAPKAIGKFDDAAMRAQSATSDPRVHVLTIPIDRD